MQVIATPTGSEADLHLVMQLASGNMDAVAELYDRHAARVFSLARRILQDEGDAEDVVQDVFAQAWRTAPTYATTRGTVAAWLLMMARTRAIDRLRARRARPDTRSDGVLDNLQDEGTPVQEQMVAAEQSARIRLALVDLPVDQRTALELAYFEGLTQSEIAERLSTPLGTVKTRIRTALTTLRRSLRT